MPGIFFRIVFFLFSIFLYSYSWGQATPHFKMPAGVTTEDFVPSTIILKIKPAFASSCGTNQIDLPELSAIFQQLGVNKLQKKFPGIKAPEQEYNSCKQKLADLSLIYEIEYASSENLETAINNIIATGFVEYAQPHYIVKPLDYIPNDPLITNQYHLTNIKAFSAWDITKGDTNVVVGISDWGTDFTHPDLAANVKLNYYDPIDGIDNDNDGYLDNYWGWDLGENDNNPMGTITHGTFVAGLSGAVPDNNTGVSGTGFNCKFLPLKVANADNLGTMNYESIVYAVEHGCSIVNCSWGNTFNSGQYGQDVIDYATINKGALVIAACGNDNNAVPFYPASLNYVLSVASSDINDHKSGSSSYGLFVDLAAPGDNVWSTEMGGLYNAFSGTSYSSPVTAGCAALLKSKYPSLTGLQIGEKLKVSADVIDTIPANLPYKGLLGSGRLNIFEALNDSLSPSVQMDNFLYLNNNNEVAANPGDTVYLSGDYLNYLSPTSANFKVTISCASPYVGLIDSVFYAGVIPALGIVSNASAPFSIVIKPGIPLYENLTFKFSFLDTNYNSEQYFSINANLNSIDIDTNLISMTLTSEGALGFVNGNIYQGLGFRYNNGETMLYSGGFIIGKSGTQVSDVIYNDSGGFDHDFAVMNTLKRVFPPAVSDFEAIGMFNDSNASASKINVQVTQRAYAWKNPPMDKFVILEYTIINKSNYSQSGIYAGLYADWDIGFSQRNRIEYDESMKLGYCFSTDGSDYAGMALLSGGDPYHYGFDNDGMNGSIKITDGFATDEKYVALRSNRNAAGLSGSGNDVSEMFSTGPFTIGSEDSVKVVFALLAGDHLGDLQNSVAAANQAYFQTGISAAENPSSGPVLFQNQPNPFNEKTTITFFLNKKSSVELSLTDILGNSAGIIFKGLLDKGLHSYVIKNDLKPGIYVYTLSGEGFSLKKKMCVAK
ncbi:MAG TPA: S8 family serine peptidase [Bacteroidales bacterium]|nr:S8 family serine peptidase [Bacteroidales bacterium]